MEDNKNTMMGVAMHFGLIMGIFWIVKYVFFILSFQWAWTSGIFWIMTIAVPFIAYSMTKSYRTYCGGSISFFQAWMFGTLVYFFAAVLLSVEAYVFYRYIASPDFITQSMQQTIELLSQTNLSADSLSKLKGINFTPITMTIQGIFNNTFYGIIFSIPVAALLCKNNLTGTIENRDKK